MPLPQIFIKEDAFECVDNQVVSYADKVGSYCTTAQQRCASAAGAQLSTTAQLLPPMMAAAHVAG